MQTVVGVFESRRAAQRGVSMVNQLGIAAGDVQVMTPADSVVEEAESVSETEQPGMGKTVGGLVGAATGAFAGLSIAAVLPLAGGGLVLALGVGAAALLGAAGVFAGDSLDKPLEGSLATDELYVYEDALRKGRTVVIVEAKDDEQATTVRGLFDEVGAESVDAAREQWWVGLRDATLGEYEASGQTLSDADAVAFRCGFEAAQLLALRGQTFAQAEPALRTRHAESCDRDSFQRGYEMGQAHQERLRRSAADSDRPARADAERMAPLS